MALGKCEGCGSLILVNRVGRVCPDCTEGRERMRANDAKARVLATLRKAATNGDNEGAHGIADDALLAFLRDVGHGDVADAFDAAREKVGFWYA